MQCIESIINNLPELIIYDVIVISFPCEFSCDSPTVGDHKKCVVSVSFLIRGNGFFCIKVFFWDGNGASGNAGDQYFEKLD